jgi:hypothetical protein
MSNTVGHGKDDPISLIEKIAFGYLKVANEVMCRPVRALTESKG